MFISKTPNVQNVKNFGVQIKRFLELISEWQTGRWRNVSGFPVADARPSKTSAETNLFSNSFGHPIYKIIAILKQILSPALGGGVRWRERNDCGVQIRRKETIS